MPASEPSHVAEASGAAFTPLDLSGVDGDSLRYHADRVTGGSAEMQSLAFARNEIGDGRRPPHGSDRVTRPTPSVVRETGGQTGRPPATSHAAEPSEEPVQSEIRAVSRRSLLRAPSTLMRRRGVIREGIVEPEAADEAIAPDQGALPERRRANVVAEARGELREQIGSVHVRLQTQLGSGRRRRPAKGVASTTHSFRRSARSPDPASSVRAERPIGGRPTTAARRYRRRMSLT